jgi:DNA-binding response OmpR family regulator
MAVFILLLACNLEKGRGRRVTRILVVEDDLGIQAFLEMALVDEGFDVSLASNGRVALELMTSVEPDLILLDMWMPGMDGRTFLEHYRRLPGKNTPIIIMTAYDDSVRDGTILDTASDCLIKPFDLGSLFECIHKHLPPSG